MMQTTDSSEYFVKNCKVNSNRSSPVVSPVGTIRGNTNQVKERIKLFMGDDIIENIERKDHENTTDDKDLLDNENPKVVIYTTSIGLIRATKSQCLFVKKAFRNLMIKTEERDIVIEKYRREFETLFTDQSVPLVLVNNQVIGGAKEVEELLETGRIQELIKDIPKVYYFSEPCENCADHGFTNCPKCLGSGRSRITRIGSSRELNYLKCTGCTDGMIRCEDCKEIIN